MTPAPVPNYAHRATFIKVHDGDSFWLEVDFGKLTSGVTLTLPLYFRLANMDTWEISGPFHPLDPAREKGFAARDFTEKILKEANKITVQTVKPGFQTVGDEDKYGRVLAQVWADDSLLSDLLRANGSEKQKP